MSRVLVVEDDLELRGAVERGLRAHGFEVAVTDDVDSAMSLLEEQSFDVLLTDLRLRDESGLELIRAASATSFRTRPVLMSAFATARDHEVATQLGTVRVLSKPFTIDELVVAVRHAIEASEGLRGSIHGLTLVDLLQMYHFGRRSVRIGVHGRTPGEVLMREGEIVHAEAGSSTGEEALRALLATTVGAIQTGVLPAGAPRTLEKDFDTLVLDCLRDHDERSRGGSSEDDERTSWIDKLTFSPPPGEEDEDDSKGGVPMGRIDDACREVVGKVDGAVACGVVDLDTGMLLGIHNGAGYTQTLNEVVAAATMDLFRGPNVGRIEHMVRTHRGVPENGEHYFQEVHVTSANNYHFAKTIKSGKAVIMLVTKKTTNIGMGWAMLKSVIPSVEPHVP